jgi:hypothetical protein
MPLVRIVRDWVGGNIFRALPASGEIDGVQFTEDDVSECDYLVVINRTPRAIRTRVPPENVWLLIQEPAAEGKDFVWEGHERFARVFTHFPLDDSPLYTTSPPATSWQVNRTYEGILAEPMPAKTDLVSAIASDLQIWPGHRARLAFIDLLRREPVIRDHVYGRGSRYIEDKWDALAPYRYSVAIENSSSPDYWTEKLADCFVSWTVPLYFGCTNIDDYFPKDSYIWLPIDRPDEALSILRSLRSDDGDWESRLDALNEARELSIHRYSLYEHISRLVLEHEATAKISAPAPVVLPNREASIGYRIRRRWRLLTGKHGEVPSRHG